MNTRKYLCAALLLLAFVVACDAQSRTNRLFRPCPASTTPATVEIQRDGDIDLVPCSGRNILLNGSALANGFTVSGSNRTTFFPYFSTETNLAPSGFYWTGTQFVWSDPLQEIFLMRMAPSNTAGLFQVGDLENLDNYFEIIDADGQARLQAGSVALYGGDVSLNSAAGSQFYFAGSTFMFSVPDSDGTITATDIWKWNFQRVTTAAGTTGNRTINSPAGSVNFAAGTAALTVTNSTVTASSYILATARTNDATCSVKNVVPAAGSFVINMTANCTGETAVGFFVVN